MPAGELLLISAMAVVWMAMLAWAVWAQRLPLWAVGAALGLNLFTFLVYASDKNAAQRGMWRTKESHLHLLALVGGWPAALAKAGCGSRMGACLCPMGRANTRC